MCIEDYIAYYQMERKEITWEEFEKLKENSDFVCTHNYPFYFFSSRRELGIYQGKRYFLISQADLQKKLAQCIMKRNKKILSRLAKE